MSKPVNKSLIGAFVVGAVALVCIAVAVFGSGKLFKKTYDAVMFFDGSLSGLNMGSPVVLRGVPVGRVVSIRVVGDMKTREYTIPVVIQIDSEKIDIPEGVDFSNRYGPSYLNDLLARGLRGRLASQSFLTGQLMVELNFFPPSEAGAYKGKVEYYEGLPVLPSIPSKLDSLMQRFNTLPLEQITQNILYITDDIHAFLNKGDVQNLVMKLNLVASDLQKLTDPLQSVIRHFNSFAKNASGMSRNASAMFEDVQARINQTLETMNTSLATLNTTLADIRGVVNPASLPVLELTRSLREISEAARAVRSLADTLDHSPDSLLVGKGTVK